MNRRHFLLTLAAAAAYHPLTVLSKEVAAADPEASLRWGYLGNDGNLTEPK